MKKNTAEFTQACLVTIAGFTETYNWRTINVDATMVSLGFGSGTSGDLVCRQLRRVLQNHATKYQGVVRLDMITKKDSTVKAVLIRIIDSCKLRGINESDKDLEKGVKDLQKGMS